MYRERKKPLLKNWQEVKPRWKKCKGSVEFKTEEEARAALFQAEDSKKQAEEVYQKVLAEAKKAANAQKQAETLDQPLPAGDSGTEEVCGRSKNFLYRSNGNKTDDRI